MFKKIHNTNEKSIIPSKIKPTAGKDLVLNGTYYKIVGEIGRGGFAHVYSIKDKQDKLWAIKVLDLWTVRPDEYEFLSLKFDQEFRAGQINSNAIVKSYSQGYIDGNPYIIMEYCPNGSLAKRLKEFYSRQSYERLGINILQGLIDLHREGIIHRDLKPENILFSTDDQPKITDFGISGNLKSRLTTRNFIGMVDQVWGTPLYSPPEQLNHHKAFKLTAPSMDIFSFGVLMYEIISGGHHPYGDHKELLENISEYVNRVNAKRIIPLTRYRTDISTEWIKIIDKCLEPKPQDRFAYVDEVMHTLKSSREYNYIPQSENNADSIHAVLKVVDGENAGHIYYLFPMMETSGQRTLKIGWDDPDLPSANEIGLKESNSRFISRQHASISKCADGWYIRDGQSKGDGVSVASKNGTFVNFQLIESNIQQKVKDGDIISIGDVRLKFMLL